jgi:hypothetical protein
MQSLTVVKFSLEKTVRTLNFVERAHQWRFVAERLDPRHTLDNVQNAAPPLLKVVAALCR